MIDLCIDARTGVYYMEACNVLLLHSPSVVVQQAQNE